MAKDRLRIVVGGYLVRAPLGGQAWHYLQYVIGLARLGHEVLYLEDSCFLDGDEYAWYCDPETGKWGSDVGVGFPFVQNAFTTFGLENRWTFYEARSKLWHGPAANWAIEFCKTADLFINVSAVNPIRPWLEAIPRRVFVDTDPAFTQIRLLTNSLNRDLGAQHNVFATFGENIPAGRSTLPTDPYTWIPTRQPMVLDAWPVTPGNPNAALTAVMAWRTYSTLEHEGQRYGAKADSFPPFMDLPIRSTEKFELALGGDGPRELLAQNGWRLLERGPKSLTDYQEYLRGSKAEFGIAKEGYVVSRCGWFSERSAAYLASGRPVVVQDTGFPAWLPSGRGVLPFRTPDDALAALEDLNTHYERHCRDARDIVTEYFDFRRVLPNLIDEALRCDVRVQTPAGV